MNDVALRQATVQDKTVTVQWPAYLAEFSDLDYVLRTSGWLDE